LRKDQAAKRRQEIEDQLVNSAYGIAYIDATEKITQLNRSIENTLAPQVTELQTWLLNELGITEGVFNGKATALELALYFQRIIDPIVTTLIEEFTRKFLSKTAITQGQAIRGFGNRLAHTTMADLIQMSDTMTRNEILTSNEMRAMLGYIPHSQPGADELRNKNMPLPTSMETGTSTPPTADTSAYDTLMDDTLGGLESEVNRIMESLNAS
jgi:hypothetical protein